MARLAYLTFDDGPTKNTPKLLEMLGKRNVKATLFCRGDRLSEYVDIAVQAVKEGHVIANHSYSHRPASTISMQEWEDDLLKTEAIIAKIYRDAKAKRPGKYYRFPYFDRGDADRLERRLDQWGQTREASHLFALQEPVSLYQKRLAELGFTQPFIGVDHPIFKFIPSINAVDCLATFTTFDWKLTRRHAGQYGLGIDDLRERMVTDYWMSKGKGNQVVLFHDDPDDLTESAEQLIGVIMDKLRIKIAAPPKGPRAVEGKSKPRSK